MRDVEQVLRGEIGVTATEKAMAELGPGPASARTAKVGDLMIALERHADAICAVVAQRLTAGISPPGLQCDVSLAVDDARPAFLMRVRLAAADADTGTGTAPALPPNHIAIVRDAMMEVLTAKATAHGFWRPVVGLTVPVATPPEPSTEPRAAATEPVAESSARIGRWFAIAIAFAALAAAAAFALSVGS